MSIDLSIIIPAYNEEARIASTLETILCNAEGSDRRVEIIIVDDHSQDNTEQIIKHFVKNSTVVKYIRNSHNRGKGYSVKQGVLVAQGDYILFTDADNSTPIEEVEKLLFLIQAGRCDIAIGSRALALSKIEIKQPFYRMAMGKIFNIFVRMILGINIRDSQCGFKCFPKKIAKRIFSLQHLERFCFDAELIFIAKLKKYRVKEVPIVWRNSEASKVNPIKDSTRMFFDLLKIRQHHLHGHYEDS